MPLLSRGEWALIFMSYLKFYIGVTDNAWFDFLSKQTPSPDEVNFWQPGGSAAFHILQPGEPFLFKLRYPRNKITGGGFFVKHSILPLSLAWETFGEKNGAENFESFRSKIMQLRSQQRTLELDPMIGCIILNEPFFFSEDEWVSAPKDWSPNIVQGKSYDIDNHIGAELWNEIQAHIVKKPPPEKISEESSLYGTAYLSRARLRQGAFRVLVTDAYNRRCAITRERTLPVIEAAHIFTIYKIWAASN